MVAVTRPGLLPRSGIGVDGPFLIIAPPGNPVISLDARLLDRIELIGQSPTAPLVMAGSAAVGLVAGAVLMSNVFVSVGMAYLAQERYREARRRKRSRDLLLSLGDLDVALHVADGPAAAKRIADHLKPYTRTAPITRPDVYEDARRRLEAHARGTSDREVRRELEHGLMVGSDVVHVQGEFLQVGSVAFRLEEVRDYAQHGANLPLPGGRLLQAAMGLLVVAAEDRARRGEDIGALKQRIADYEQWTGRTAGR